ncbi:MULTISPECIES: hypothetical protein [unclassified Streptomyces]|uniref:hypothetical protein n=1 Tax=unclassified Streptomyces TaxID=2593676 RepID=UPI00190B54DD|nr:MULTISPECIES: hypothetical protein [unclassified Streptomyces]MBK3563220.1 hypothetical protein [Streptomyces sp. MBT62]MBK6013209.1 hypothetical protein [Streptomyces sp. MBT53]
MTLLGTFKGNPRNDLGWLNSAGRPDPEALFHRANLPRTGLDDIATAASGVLCSVALYLQDGDLVSNLTFISAGTAGATLTNQIAALYNGAGALLVQSADKTNEAWAADTAKTFALATAQRITRSGIYYAALAIAASTVPTLVGSTCAKPFLTGEGNLAQTSGSGLTATAPATIATPAFKRAVPLVIAT